MNKDTVFTLKAVAQMTVYQGNHELIVLWQLESTENRNQVTVQLIHLTLILCFRI